MKTPQQDICEILRVNATAGVLVSAKAMKRSFAWYGVRIQEPLHDKSLWESGLQPPLRTNPIQLAVRAILFGRLPRELQTSSGTQQSLLEMAL
jgi:hypothetical protein